MLTMAKHTIPGLDNCFKRRGLSTFYPALLNLIAQLTLLLIEFLHCFRHSSKELWGGGAVEASSSTWGSVQLPPARSFQQISW